MKLMNISEYPFNRIEINWSGPYPWKKEMSSFIIDDKNIMAQPGIYRAESSGQNRKIIKYIGSASEGFNKRLTSQHRIKSDLVDGQFRNIRMFLGTISIEGRMKLTRANYVEIEYILQNVHYHDLISWHGLNKLPKTSRGEGWHIVNKGDKGHLHRVVAYPAFAVSGRDSS